MSYLVGHKNIWCPDLLISNNALPTYRSSPCSLGCKQAGSLAHYDSVSAGTMPLDSHLHDSIMHVVSHCFNLAPNFGFLFGQLGTLGLSISLHRELEIVYNPPLRFFSETRYRRVTTKVICTFFRQKKGDMHFGLKKLNETFNRLFIF
jgi:hypothetical protein